MRSTFKLLLAVLLWLPTLVSAQPGFDDMPEVKVSAKLSGSAFVPGQRAFVVVVLDHGPELHSWPSIDQDVLPPELAEFAIRTEVSLVDVPEWLSVGPVQWPEPKPAEVPNITGTGSMEALTYKDRAIVYVPMLLAADAPIGEHEIRVSVGLQACDESQCYIPQQEVRTLTVKIVAEGGGQLEDPDFAGFDASVYAKPWAADDRSVRAETPTERETGATTTVVGARPKFLGLVELPAPGSSAFLVAIALASVVGGFVLNLTPCVLPMIPLKVMTLTHHAGESRAKAVALGFWMFLGIVLFWSALSVPVLTVKAFADPSMIFGIWYLTGGLGLFIILMAFGMLGLFSIHLPQWLNALNPESSNGSGALVQGVMTGFFGLPCFGFVVGPLLPAATIATTSLVLILFVSMGVGMGLPYLLLALFPGLLKKVPRTGPASDLVKQVMALLLLAAGAYFFGSGLLALVAERPYFGKVLHWWAMGFCVVSAGVWLVYRTIQITKRPARRLSMLVIAALLGASGIWVANNQTAQSQARWEEKERARELQLAAGGYVSGAWNEYTPELVEAALADGKVVVMDFTAEWCLNCKALKAAVLNVEPVKGRLMSDDVVAFEVDLTSRRAQGWQKLRDLGQTGIPTLAVFGPGQEGGPWIANAYSSGQVISAIDAAAEGEATQVTAR